MTGENQPKRDRLAMVVGTLVVLIIVVHPTSWAFSLAWLGRALGFSARIVEKAPRLTLADILIWVAGAVLVVRMFLRRDFRILEALPLPAVVLVLLAALSMLFAQNKLTAVADVIQVVEYFVVLYLLVIAVVTTRARLERVCQLWLSVASIVAIWGLVHYLNESRGAVQVSATFLNRNILSGYLAMLLPLSWGLILHSPRALTRLQCLGLAAIGLVVMLAGGPWVGAVIGIGIVTFIRSKRIFPLAALGLVVLVLGVYPLLPRDNASVLAKSVCPIDEDAGSRSAVERLSPRYVEWQACMRFLTPSYDPPGWHRYNAGVSRGEHVRRWLVGFGIGNYQQAVNEYYALDTKPNENTVEPDTHNLYLVTAVSMGVPAMLTLVWLVGAFIRRTALACTGTTPPDPIGTGSLGVPGGADPFLRGLLSGCIGSLAGLLVTNLFTSTLVHGSGPAMMLILAFAAVGARLSERTAFAAE